MDQFDAIVRTNVSDSSDGNRASKIGYTPVSFSSSSSSAVAFDGVDQGHDGEECEDLCLYYYSSVSSFSARQRQTQTRRLCVYGGFALTLIVLVAFLSSSSHSSLSPNHSYSYSSNTNTNTNGKNSVMDGVARTSPYSFHARHPLAGKYNDTLELYIREDISALFPDDGSDKEMRLTTIVESVKTVQDLPDMNKQWDVTTTRLVTDKQLPGESVHCDTKDTSHNTPLVCTALLISVGTKMTFVIDGKGTIVSEVDTDALGHIMENSHSAGGTANFIESVDNNLQYLPDHPVQINDEWESRFELQSVGDYVGKTTLVGITQCEEESSPRSSSSSSNNTCAVLKSSGQIFMDVRAMSGRFGTMGVDLSYMTIINGTVSQTMYWNDALSYFAHVEALMNFTIQMAVPGETASLIPVHEIIQQTTILLQQ